jgi:putative membrane protein
MKWRKITQAVAFVSTVTAASAATISCGSDGNGSTSSGATTPKAPDTTQNPAKCPPQSTPSTPQGQPVGFAAFSANEVAGIVLAINTAEVTLSRLAQRDDLHQDVRAFADKMVTDHSQIADKLQPILKDIPNDPEDPTVLVIQGHDNSVADDLRARLEPGEPGQALTPDQLAQFELAFMTAQVEAHAKLLSLIDHALVPSIDKAIQGGTVGGPLRELLLGLRDITSQHLDLALQVHQSARRQRR